MANDAECGMGLAVGIFGVEQWASGDFSPPKKTKRPAGVATGPGVGKVRS